MCRWRDVSPCHGSNRRVGSGCSTARAEPLWTRMECTCARMRTLPGGVNGEGHTIGVVLELSPPLPLPLPEEFPLPLPEEFPLPPPPPPLPPPLLFPLPLPLPLPLCTGLYASPYSSPYSLAATSPARVPTAVAAKLLDEESIRRGGDGKEDVSLGRDRCPHGMEDRQRSAPSQWTDWAEGRRLLSKQCVDEWRTEVNVHDADTEGPHQ
jgi:hypothetical protein